MISAFDTKRRVVVTGVGVVSPLGNSVDEFWQALVDGRSGIVAEEPSPQVPMCAGVARDFTGAIDDFGPLEKGLKKTIRKALKLMNRETQMGVAAAQQALNNSELLGVGYEPERVGVCFGAGNVSMMPQDFEAGVRACSDAAGFDFRRWGREGLDQIAPLWLLKCLPNMPACYMAIYNDLRGPNNSITQREAAANLSVAEACYAIQEGAADAMVSGATGTTILPFNRLHAELEGQVALDTQHPDAVCRPFDRDRQGAVIAEGAAALVLEEYQAALDRGATIFGEILGVGSSCVVSPGRVVQRDKALANAIGAALRKAHLSPDDIGHVHAHGLSTHRSDIEEATAIRKVFGDRTSKLPVVAAKSNTGNAGAGSGALELVASLLALKKNRLFPVLNYEEPDPQCPVAPVRSTDCEAGESFVNLSIVAQGQASCLAVGACD
ncbi:3-oxoacyl-[acyl-carrier-protein] synthase 2 [Symmachiella dynata]|uniref:beta-ketoacyl-[acyl-carrier-protein] synthase family protein n=1 Tax=Symmachiella dynata TaxID=2527995 RepID=UPI00118C12EF|nr:beta-ketoacyl-[acyl-carrier-protein] synthase family protein [Symmachiella dynata]QDT51122.1 3-oxoacyl-[acyl-carrier-protein] synthase 2 [Symmachiella dynata]